MKKIAFTLILALLVSMFSGCTGTTVVYTNCTCPAAEHGSSPTTPIQEGALKTGLSVTTSVKEKDGTLTYDVSMVAVTVDDGGVIRSCVIDGISANVVLGDNGTIEKADDVLTKNELGEAYGMKAYANSKYEWNEQAAALAEYAVGKTVEELKNGAVNEAGMAKDADLASVATIYIGGCVSGIEAAANNATHLGAQSGDILKLVTIGSFGSSTPVNGEKAGNAQLDSTFAAVTMNGDKITSCIIDSVQAKVPFDTNGKVTAEMPMSVQTKNELGEAYGMKAYANAKYEWNEQAAAFAAYVTGKTLNDVAGIAVDESSKPTDADLASSVTIKIGDFMALIAKAAQ